MSCSTLVAPTLKRYSMPYFCNEKRTFFLSRTECKLDDCAFLWAQPCSTKESLEKEPRKHGKKKKGKEDSEADNLSPTSDEYHSDAEPVWIADACFVAHPLSPFNDKILRTPSEADLEE